MKVRIQFNDENALTMEEVMRQAHHFYGKNIKVEVGPDSSMAYDHIYFGLQQLITHTQLSVLYDKGANYQQDLATIRSNTLDKITEIIDQVIIDNEERVT